MKKFRLLYAAGALLLSVSVLAGCSGTGKDDDDSGGGGGDSHDYTYAVITHAAPGDAFWDRVKAGAERAGDDYGVTVQYSNDADPAKQSQLIDAAVADKVDGIVVSMANPDGLEDSIKAAVAAGVPVITINSGIDQSAEFGAITHVGQSETIAGAAVGERAEGRGAHQGHLRDPGGRQRRARGPVQGRGRVVRRRPANVQVDGTDDNAVTATITSALQADPSIDTVLTLGGQQAIERSRRSTRPARRPRSPPSTCPRTSSPTSRPARSSSRSTSSRTSRASWASPGSTSSRSTATTSAAVSRSTPVRRSYQGQRRRRSRSSRPQALAEDAGAGPTRRGRHQPTRPRRAAA